MTFEKTPIKLGEVFFLVIFSVISWVTACAKPVEDETGMSPFSPVDLVPYPLPYHSSRNRNCALDNKGAVACWARDAGTSEVVVSKVAEFPLMFSIDGSSYALCGLGGSQGVGVGEDELWCWGILVGRAPVHVMPNIMLSGIDSSETHVCAFTKSGLAYCAGNNDYGQLGGGTTEAWYGEATSSWIPVKIEGLSEPITDLALGHYFTCLLTNSGSIFCWGRNQDGELGIGSFLDTGILEDTTAPAQLPITEVVTNIEAGGTFACAWIDGSSGRKSMCWGTIEDFHSDVPVDFPSLASATSISIQREFACAIVSQGNVYCFGNNDSKQLGRLNKWSDWAVPLTAKAISVTTSFDGACALLEDSRIACWGGSIGNKPDYFNLFIKN